MSKARPPRIRLLLRVWAGKLKLGSLDPADTDSLVELLCRLADGESVEEVFGIWRPANRPPDPALEQRLYEMAMMRLPVELGGEGKSFPETIAETVQRHGKSPETIRKDYMSERGKEMRKNVNAHGELAASLGFAEKWQGGKTHD